MPAKAQPKRPKAKPARGGGVLTPNELFKQLDETRTELDIYKRLRKDADEAFLREFCARREAEASVVFLTAELRQARAEIEKQKFTIARDRTGGGGPTP